MIIVIMGAAGSGKSTVGRRLSEQLRWVFLDGDAVHSPENIAKMARGMPLTDEDRRPRLHALRTSIAEWAAHHIGAVLAASLLKQTYRDTVVGGYEETEVKLVYLQASRALLQTRLTTRTGHFAGIALLDSQLALLDEPADALVADASQSPDHLVQTIRSTWHL